MVNAKLHWDKSDRKCLPANNVKMRISTPILIYYQILIIHIKIVLAIHMVHMSHAEE